MGGIVSSSYLLLGIIRINASFEDLENPDSNLATEVISADQVVIGKFGEKLNILTYLKVNALIATEDERFMSIQVLGRGTLRAIASLGTSGGQVP
jgi:penicillin-binding protein 1A